MSLIHRRLGSGLVVKGYAGPLAFVKKGWHEVRRVASRITRTLSLESKIWRKNNCV